MSGFLDLSGVSKHFGAIVAVDEVSLSFEPGEVSAVIGPNGAGKTTLCNLIIGEETPTDGEIRFRDERIDGLQPFDIVEEGIVKSYQVSNYFPDLTVLENVRLAAQARHTEFGLRDFVGHHARLEEPLSMARDVLERVDLTEEAERKATNLAYGQQRELEVAIALATDPEVVILDEPTAGMDHDDIHGMIDLIGDIAETTTVLFIEHNMEVVMTVADRVVVMNDGQVLADGSPTEIQSDEEVQEAYLGSTV